jgi:protein-S-isoprenylcysteine O-methyltransferase Ste14
MSTTPPSENQPAAGISAAEARERDARGAAILGWFHLALAATVLVGTVYAKLPIDRLLNVAAAVVLSIVGAALLWGSRRLSREPGDGFQTKKP